MTKTNPKIYVDAYLLNKEPQGTQTYIRELYKEFAKQNPNYQIYFSCFKDTAIINEFSEYQNVHFLFLKQPIRVLRMFFEIPKLIKKYQFDFAHFQYVIPFFRTKNCKYIVTIHDILFNDFRQYFSKLYIFKRNFLFKYSSKKSNLLLTVSNYSKDRISKVYGIKTKNIYVVPNGVNQQYLENYNKEEVKSYIKKKFGISDYILYVSRIEPRKNQELLLESFLELKNDLELVFIGKETLTNTELDKIKTKLSAQQNHKIHFLEDINYQEIIYFYKAANYFIYPSLAEGFGIPPIEAGALEIPVLCCNETAMQDFTFFEPYFVSAANKALFKHRFKELLKTKNLDNLKNVRESIQKKYTWKASAKKFKEILNENT